MKRFLSAVFGILIAMGGLTPAQVIAPQNAARRFQHRPHPAAESQDPAESGNGGQIVPVVAAQQIPVQPPRQAAVPPPAATPGPAATPQAPEPLAPPTPAQVTYENGMLTVQAMNSTLGGLLTAIRNKTGIQFEGLEGGAPERVVVSMGPAPESEVLVAILGGSSFDYVVMGRPDSPGTVQKVLLIPRGGAAQGALSAQQTRPAAAQDEGDEEDAPEEQASSGDPEPQNTPARPPVNQAQQQTQPQQPQPDQATPSTPEQLLQQLIQKQQQLQQQQQGSSPQNQAPLKPQAIPQ